MNPSQEILDFDNFFDRLPNDVVFSIFNKVYDVKSLCLSMSVCKRFHSIIPQVDEIFLSIPRKTAVVKEYYEEITHKNRFKNLVIRTLMKPLNFIFQMIKFKSKNEVNDCDSGSYYVPNEVLKPFEEIQALHLRLPCHGIQKLGSRTGKNNRNSTNFLKWKAEFGSQLHSCVILGAKSWTENCENEENFQETERGLEQESLMIADEELKLRIVWTISCLIAASARHYLIQETVKEHKMIKHVVVSDENDQGRLCMNKEQIEELKDLKGNSNEGMLSDSRSRVPALMMKMWYTEKMELPGYGKVMEGATLVVIKPASGDVKGRSNADLVAGAFGGEGEEKLLGEFARKLVLAKKCYTLEMNSF